MAEPGSPSIRSGAVRAWRPDDRDRALMAGVAAGAAGAGMVVVGAWAAGWSSDVALVLGVSVVIGVVLAAMHRVSTGVAFTPWPPITAADEPHHAIEDRVTFLERRLELSVGDARVFSARVQPALRAIVAHAAAHHHGVDVERDPAAGRRLVGDQLWDLIHDPPSSPPTPAELSAAVARIERLAADG